MVRGVSIGGTASPITGFSVQVNKNPLIEEGLYSTVPARMFHGAETVSGSIDLIFREIGEIQPLVNAINTGSFPASKTLEVYGDINSDGYTFASAIFNSIDITASSKDFVRVKYNFTAKHAQMYTGGSITEPSYSGTVGIFYSTTVKIGSNVIKTSSMNLHMEIPIDTDYFVLGNPWLYDYYQNGVAQITGSIEISKSDYTYFQTMIGDVPYDMAVDNDNDLSLGGGTIIIVIGSNSGTVLQTITLHNCKFSDGSMDVQGRQRINRTINFQVIANESSGQNVITIS